MLRGRTTWSIHRSVRSEFELRDRSQRREFCVIRMIVYGSRYTLYVLVMTCAKMCTWLAKHKRLGSQLTQHNHPESLIVIYGFIWEPRKLSFLSLRLHYTESTSTRSRTYRYAGESSIE